MTERVTARPCTTAAFSEALENVPAPVRAMLDTAPVWFWTTDADHLFTGLSEQLFRHTGTRPSDYLGRSRRDFIVGLAAYTPEGEAHLRCIEAHEPFRDFTYRHTFTNNHQAWVSTSGDPVFDEAGLFCGYQGMAMLLSAAIHNGNLSLGSERDLLGHTAELQRKVEARTDALNQSYRLLAGVLNSMDQGLIVYDVGPNGRAHILLSNPRFCDLMNVPRVLVQPGLPVDAIFDYCDNRGDFEGLPHGVLGTRAAAQAARPVLLRPGGTGHSVIYHTTHRSDTGAIVTLTDVTDIEDQRRALDLARRSAQQASDLLSEVVEAMGEGLLVTTGNRLIDEDKLVEVVNPAYRRLFNLREDEIAPGMVMRDVLTLLRDRGDASSREDFQLVEARLNTGDPVMMQVPSTGRSYSVRATARPSGGFVLVHTDVTDLQARTVALDKARRCAELASSAKSTFLAAMTHEIRTPMNGIIGMAELLVESGLSGKQELFAKTILDSGAALIEVVGDVLDFSKIEAGRVDLVTGPVDLPHMAQEIHQLLSHRARQAGLDLRVSVAPDMPAIWRADGPRLRQILINLVGNAIKFTPQGHIALRLSPRRDQPGVLFEIEDSGIGVPPERIATIFEAFDQVVTEDGRHLGGTGLGLEITRRLVSLMGGSLSVRSEVGQGSVFSVSLPLVTADGDALPPPALTHRMSDMGQRHLLIAEDNLTNQLVLRHMLAPLGARLTICGDRVEVVEACARGDADLVLMDISMPRKDGISATHDIRRAEAACGVAPIPIIALTGNATAEDRARCMAAGMNGFLTKPLRKATVLAELARFLPENTPPRQAGAPPRGAA